MAMTYTCGIDIVDRAKFEKALERHGARLMRRIFAAAELANLRRRRNKALFPLGFAFKEAVWKALPEEAQKKNYFREIRILWRDGKPRLSIAHFKGEFLLDWAVSDAVVMAVAVRTVNSEL